MHVACVKHQCISLCSIHVACVCKVSLSVADVRAMVISYLDLPIPDLFKLDCRLSNAHVSISDLHILFSDLHVWITGVCNTWMPDFAPRPLSKSRALSCCLVLVVYLDF